MRTLITLATEINDRFKNVDVELVEWPDELHGRLGRFKKIAFPASPVKRPAGKVPLLFCAEFNTRRLSRHRLSQSGSAHSAVTSTFLESDQTDFRPTDVIEDADGSLLIADTGSWYMICCPTSKIAKPHVLGAIYRIQQKGSKKHEDPRGLKLDWGHPQVSWLSDSRPAVVKRAIDSLASANNIDALRSSPASLAAVWALHRISGGRARAAVREFLFAEDPDVRAAAIHSVALWRDREALNPLMKVFSRDDPLRRRLAAMALGRIGDPEAVEPLLQNYSTEMDLYPKILPVRWKKPDQEKLAQQEQRLNELSVFLPKGDAERGAKLFNNQDRSKCTICHLQGDKGVRLGPDLTWIGAIRSERDLLEAIVYPSASIARYHEVVNVPKPKRQCGIR